MCIDYTKSANNTFQRKDGSEISRIMIIFYHNMEKNGQNILLIRLRLV